MILIVSYAIALLGAAGVLVPLRIWVHSRRGIDTIRSWPTPIVIPLQTAVALLWLQALLWFPWMVWSLRQVVGDPWWSIFRSAQVVFLLVVVPVTVAIVGDSWLKLRPLPEAWSLLRILLGGVAGIAFGNFTAGLPVDGAGDAGRLVFVFALLTTLFLTRWWLITHPIKREGESQSPSTTA